MKTPQEFYDFFKVIPDEKWTIGQHVDPSDENCRCVLGHLGFESFIFTGKKEDTRHENVRNLAALFVPHEDFSDCSFYHAEETVYIINDCGGEASPKDRILRALVRAGAKPD